MSVSLNDREKSMAKEATKKAAPKGESKTDAKHESKADAKSATKAEAKTEAKDEPKSDAKAGKKAASSSKPKAKPDQQPPSAFSKPLKPSKELAAVVGEDSLPRTVVVSKVWEYIKKNDLQNEKNKREILADDKLKAVFGKDKVTMFEMNKYLAQHLKG